MKQILKPSNAVENVIPFILGNSFIKLSQELLNEGYEFILTEKLLCQDPTEQYFSKVRDSTGSNSPLTMAQFNNFTRIHSIQSIEVEKLQPTVNLNMLSVKLRCQSVLARSD